MKRTPLYEQHVALGAKMVSFAGWEMPIEYQGIIKEHTATRTQMGLFDVSHMGEIEVTGRDALVFVQRMCTNDVSALKPGKIQYSAILNENGGVIDDCTVYHMAEQNYLLVVNAAHISDVMAQLTPHVSEFEVRVKDRSDDFGLLALQGPRAEGLLSQVSGRDLSRLQYFEWTWLELSGVALLASRTGYTGEDGFEIYIPWAQTQAIWNKLMEAGTPLGLVPIGLGARDTLRLEMGYLLSGTDMDASINAMDAGLSWVCKLEKGAFVGKKALEARKAASPILMRGLLMQEKGIPRAHYPVFADAGGQHRLGEVSSGTFSPTLKQGIALARLDRSAKLGAEVYVECRPGQRSRAKIVRPPFVQGSVKK